jgi:hypothetical protein
MARQIAAIVKNTDDGNGSIQANPVDDNMARCLHTIPDNMIAAEEKVVGPQPLNTQLRSFSAA